MTRSLPIAFSFSLGLHAAFLSGNPAVFRSDPPRVNKEIEVLPAEKNEKEPPRGSLAALPALPEEPPPYIKDTGAFSPVQKDTLVEKPVFPAWDKRTVAAASAALKPDEPARPDAGTEAPEQTAEGLSVSRQKMEQIKNTPAYMGYYSFIREKIRKIATERYTQTDEGEVTVVFILSRRGAITAATVQLQGSHASDMLKKIAVESVKRASPFPVFPPELKYGNLEFSITIHFKRKGDF